MVSNSVYHASIDALYTGQAESCKSTTLKHFKMLYAPSQFNSETRHWTFIILFNLVRSVNLILATLDYHEAFASSSDLPEIVQDDLDVSDDGKVWKTVHATESGAGGVITIPLTPAVKARWVRFSASRRSTTNPLGLNGLQVYGTSRDNRPAVKG